MLRILPGEVAWYVTGRFYAAADGSLRDAGYFLHLQGVDGPLFSGARGEATAHLTFLAEPFTARHVQNGDLTLGLDAVGDFSVYFQADPRANFCDPASFGAGDEVARFRRVAVVTGASVGSGSANQPLLSLNVFSARLVSSKPFTLWGRRYDFRALMPNGITQWGTAASTPLPSLPGYTSIIPFVGSAITIGGAPGV
ncbi:MAG TPA: hypothetical protein VF665_18475 [Longimicrobium sp.]|jgi:hypothetical protein|uniref:hypothetical protein n=1 Tax=Longimicrobium sp. TaxID=2029185 RepID=UPI002ED80144